MLVDIIKNSTLLELKEIDVMDIYNEKENYIKLRDEAKEFLAKNNLDITKFDLDTRKYLSYGTWSKESGEYELIPLAFLELYPKDTDVICPLFKNSKVEKIGNVDNDTRGGYIAFQLYRENEYKERK